MKFRLLLASLMLLVAGPIFAQAPLFEGRWALRVGDGRTLAILELAPDPSVAGGWTGRMLRPDRFTFSGQANSDLTAFSDIAGPIVARPLLRAAQAEDGLTLVMAGRAAGETDTFLLRAAGDGARLSIPDFPIAPFPLVRAEPRETVADRWDPGRSYLTDNAWPTSTEMTAIFEADQAARAGPGPIDWAALGPQDAARRARTRALLDAGALHSGADFYHAAFVFQHGTEPADYLLAHSLAVIAAARGRPEATWIAAATLDRYLQAIGEAQIYGTQFSLPDRAPATQEPYDRRLVSDALRGALGVPPLAEQDRQRAEFEQRR